MNNFFEIKTSFKEIDFCHSLKPTVDEREIHNYHEILFYIDGDATLICDEYSKQLSSCSLIFIPKERYHFFSVASPERFERFKITLPVSAIPKQISEFLPQSVSLIESIDTHTFKTLEKMLEMTKSTDCAANGAYLFGATFILLSIFSEQRDRFTRSNRDGLISKVLLEIDLHLCDGINASSLSESFFVSPSTLSHAFKKEMGIPIHRYVTQRRLIEAEKLILEGNDPTNIYTRFGYGDYSSFYKAFRNFFGYSPSESRARKLPKI